ncbi:MAG: molybdopterin-dependent oxidoreductase [Paucibacter sp.]|nr:molybdopterin-dependent oxidoreductase [Roseateles sp.]
METRSTCPYCGVGCGVVIEHDGAQITGVRGDPDHPANFGRLCTKGSTLHLTATPLALQQRLREPQWRAARGAPAEVLGWDAMNERLAERIAAVVRLHGPDAVAFYVSGQLLTEDYHAFNKLARGVVGTRHIDSNSRLCMSSAVSAYKKTLGADAPPASYEDVEQADCLFIAGANPAWAHPVLFRRIEAAREQRPDMKIVVVDPRRTETAEFADLHLQIQPGSDVALLHGMLHACFWEGWLDAGFIDAHTSGFDALKQLVRAMTPAHAARLCGVPEAQILQAAEWFARSGRTLSLYSMGLNQSTSGTAKNSALINLHLATRQIGRPGTGPFSLTGQPNAMGGREAGGMATLLPGHRDPASAADRAEVARLWGVDALPEGPGMTALEIFEAAARGEVRVLWIACTNPAHSVPDQALVRRALERCELVIVQEAYADTATAALADVLLPAASWGEKEGTVTNSERRISRVRAAVAPPGQARADWRIVRDVARALETRLHPGRASVLAAETPEQLWLEHRDATRGRDLDITGLSYARLDAEGPQQWPFPQGAGAGLVRLYADGRFATPDGRARFQAVAYAAPEDKRDARHPFTLNTGRLRDQWHGMSRTGRLARLFEHEDRPLVHLNPQDMARRGLADGDFVRLRSRRGELVLPAQGDATLAPAQAFLPMHWGSEFVSGRGAKGRPLTGVNALTTRARCPDSQQPELKAATVGIERVALPWRLCAAGWGLDDAALAALLSEFDYARRQPIAGADGSAGQQLEAACAAPAAAALMTQVLALFGLDRPGTLRYADTRRGRLRLLRLDADGRIAALLSAGESDAGWLVDLWRSGAPAAALGRRLLAPEGSVGSVATPARSTQVCNCLDVSQARIEAVLRACTGSAPERLAAVQQQLRCGTQCGSCLPTLRRLVGSTPMELVA